MKNKNLIITKNFKVLGIIEIESYINGKITDIYSQPYEPISIIRKEFISIIKERKPVKIELLNPDVGSLRRKFLIKNKDCTCMEKFKIIMEEKEETNFQICIFENCSTCGHKEYCPAA